MQFNNLTLRNFNHSIFLGIFFSAIATFGHDFMGSGLSASAELISGSTSELKNDKNCDGTGGILAYAETKDYSLYVCSDPQDIAQPRYYRSVNKNGTSGVKLTAKTYNPNQRIYFEFYNGDYTYILQIPSEKIKNPVLMVEFPDGSGYEQKITRFLMNADTRSPISKK